MNLYLDFYLLFMTLATANLVMAALLLFTLQEACNRKANVVLGVLLLTLTNTFLRNIIFRNQAFDQFTTCSIMSIS